jgi:HK97 family phage portal protein
MSFVITSGKVQAIEQAASQWRWSNPPYATIRLAPDVYASYEEIYKRQPAVRTVVDFIARNIAQLGLDVYEKNGEDRSKALNHPLTQLLEHPLPVPGSKWTKYRLLDWTLHELGIFDEAYWLKLTFGPGQYGLLPVPRRYMDPVGTDWISPTAYRFTGNAGYRDFAAEEVVHFHGYSPIDTRSGTSPIETLRQVLAEDYAASTFREQMWRNGARVAGYIKRPMEAPNWSDQARDRFTADWKNQYTGDGPQSGGTPILEEGMDFINAGVSPKDAQYIEARQLTGTEAAMAYHINPIMLGYMSGGASQTSVPAFHRILYQDGLGPRLTQLSQDIENQVLIDLDPGAYDGSKYCEFNLAEKLRGSFEEQAAAMQALVGGPVMTVAEGRSRLNLPFLEGTDELIVPMNVTQGGLAGPTDTAPDHPNNAASNGQLPLPNPGKARSLASGAPVDLAARNIEEMLL